MKVRLLRINHLKSEKQSIDVTSVNTDVKTGMNSLVYNMQQPNFSKKTATIFLVPVFFNISYVKHSHYFKYYLVCHYLLI